MTSLRMYMAVSIILSRFLGGMVVRFSRLFSTVHLDRSLVHGFEAGDLQRSKIRYLSLKIKDQLTSDPRRQSDGLVVEDKDEWSLLVDYRIDKEL